MIRVNLSPLLQPNMGAMDMTIGAGRSLSRQKWDRRLIHGVLGNTELFRGIAPLLTAAVAAQCWTIEAKRAQQLVAKGGRLPGIFAIAYGTVKLVLRQGAGEPRVVRLVQPGETFGEATALLGRPAGFEAMAVTACRLVIVPPAAVFGLIDREPRSSRQVVSTLARRNLELLEEIESSSTQRSAQRLAVYLGSLAESGNGSGACTVRLPASKTLIASRLDMKKETLSRLLRTLTGQGLIKVDGADITLLDPALLAAVT